MRILRACASSGTACVTVTREPSSASEVAPLGLTVDYFREGGEDLPVVVQVLGNRFQHVVRRAQQQTTSVYPLENAFLLEWEEAWVKHYKCRSRKGYNLSMSHQFGYI